MAFTRAGCAIFRPQSQRPSRASIAFHLANSILLFLLLKRMTGAHWRSAAVAGLFAVHPLHVESVAWVATKGHAEHILLAADRRGLRALRERGKGDGANAKVFYGLALLCFALGLMSKPMVVTLPFVLLLLDYWPLGRFANASRQTISRLLLEKAPFLLLAIASCAITFLVQKQAGVVSPLTKITLGARLDNLPVAYGRYLAKTFWPAYLAAFYAHPRFWPLWRFITSAALLAGTTVWVVRRRKRQPYLGVGWFWFLGMLVPVIAIGPGGQPIDGRPLQLFADCRHFYYDSVGRGRNAGPPGRRQMDGGSPRLAGHRRLRGADLAAGAFLGKHRDAFCPRLRAYCERP